MGAEKALVALNGRPLISHVVSRFRPQVAKLIINANGDASRFDAFALPVVADDPRDAQAGPLAGVSAALAHAARDGFGLLASAPCDAPFLPLDMVARLMAALEAAAAVVAVAQSPRGLEPMFALWRIETLPELDAALARGEASPRRLMARLGAAQVAFGAQGGVDPFANINSIEELEAARDLIGVGVDRR